MHASSVSFGGVNPSVGRSVKPLAGGTGVLDPRFVIWLMSRISKGQAEKSGGCLNPIDLVLSPLV